MPRGMSLITQWIDKEKDTIEQKTITERITVNIVSKNWGSAQNIW